MMLIAQWAKHSNSFALVHFINGKLYWLRLILNVECYIQCECAAACGYLNRETNQTFNRKILDEKYQSTISHKHSKKLWKNTKNRKNNRWSYPGQVMKTEERTNSQREFPNLKRERISASRKIESHFIGKMKLCVGICVRRNIDHCEWIKLNEIKLNQIKWRK